LFKQIARARLGNDGHTTAGTFQRQGPTNALRGTGNYSTQSLESRRRPMMHLPEDAFIIFKD
jgi:hypothetical protein